MVCTPLLNSTVGLVGAALLSAMKPTGVLINIARGAIVDEGALYAALAARRIGLRRGSEEAADGGSCARIDSRGGRRHTARHGLPTPHSAA